MSANPTPETYSVVQNELPHEYNKNEHFEFGQGMSANPPAETYSVVKNELPNEYNKNATPPPYDSLILASMQKAKDESTGNADFARRLCLMVCCGSIVATITLVVSLVVPMASLVIGATYLNDCPRERYIPIFLIVSGVFGLLKFISSLISRCKESLAYRNAQTEQDGESAEEQCKANPFIEGLILAFMFAWTIAGSVWVYHIHKDYQSTDPTAADFCNETVYKFAFSLLTVMYSLAALVLCCGCTCVCIAVFLAVKSEEEQ